MLKSNMIDLMKVKRRYSDFVALHETLKVSGLELSLPPKKLLGNMEREFIASRQAGLQQLMNEILENPILASCVTVKKFLDEENYKVNQTGELIYDNCQHLLIIYLQKILYNLSRCS